MIMIMVASINHPGQKTIKKRLFPAPRMKVMNSNINFFLKSLSFIKIFPPITFLDKRELRLETFFATGPRILNLRRLTKQLGRSRRIVIELGAFKFL